MTKKILLAMAFVASVFACTDDYKDWSDPQVVGQPETVSSRAMWLVRASQKAGSRAERSSGG